METIFNFSFADHRFLCESRRTQLLYVDVIESIQKVVTLIKKNYKTTTGWKITIQVNRGSTWVQKICPGVISQPTDTV